MLTDVVIANKSFTRLQVPEDGNVDEVALKVIKQDCPDFLLPVKIMEIDGQQEIRYELLDGTRLCYSSMKMYKKDFAALLGNMLTPFKICNDWFLDYHNILLDTNYILLGRNGYSIKYLYIPLSQYARTDGEIMDFFSDFILRSDIMDDAHYAVDLLRTLKSDNANLMTLLDSMAQESAAQGYGSAQSAEQHGQQNHVKPIEDAKRTEQPKAVEASFGSAPGARPGYTTGEFGKEDVQGKLVGSLFGDEGDEEQSEKAAKGNKHKSGLFDIFKGKSKETEKKESRDAKKAAAAGGRGAAAVDMAEKVSQPVQQKQYGQAAVPDYMADDVTELSYENESNDNGMLRLRLVDDAGYRCPKMIELDLRQGFATVGRLDKSGNAQSDFCFDASLSFISRRHFRVEKAGNQWSIIDLNSGNGTFVNGEALIANMKHPLRSGDMVMISAKQRLSYQVC